MLKYNHTTKKFPSADNDGGAINNYRHIRHFHDDVIEPANTADSGRFQPHADREGDTEEC